MDSMKWTMDSMDFPGGIHGLFHGFHTVFTVESIWNELMELLILYHFCRLFSPPNYP